MARVALTDGSGKWFDDKAAVKFSEETRWDGRNRISRATGSQWEHEALYYTQSGRWVLNHWSAWQGGLETYSEVTLDEAARWLINNDKVDYAEVDELPEDVRQAIHAAVGALEL